MNATMPATLDWSELYTAWYSRIYNYIYRRTNDSWLAEDLTADVFVKAIDYTQRGKGATTSFSGWLFSIARNLIIDYYRRRERTPDSIDLDEFLEDSEDGRRGRTCAELLASDEPSPHELLERAMTYEKVYAAVSHLSNSQGLVISMRLDGYAFEEIAEATGNSYGGIKALQHRARENLYSLLKEAA